MSNPTYVKSASPLDAIFPTIQVCPETITIPRELFDRMENAIYDAIILWGDESDIYKPGHLTKKRKEVRLLAEEVAAYASKKGTP